MLVQLGAALCKGPDFAGVGWSDFELDPLSPKICSMLNTVQFLVACAVGSFGSLQSLSISSQASAAVQVRGNASECVLAPIHHPPTITLLSSIIKVLNMYIALLIKMGNNMV